MDRPNVTVITGTNNCSGNGSLDGAYKHLCALNYAIYGLPYMTCATFNIGHIDDRANEEISDIELPIGGNASALVSRHLHALEVKYKREIRHLIISGQLTSEQAVSMTHGGSELHVVYLNNRQNHPHSVQTNNTLEVFKHWHEKKSDNRASGQSLVYIDSSEKFSDQVNQVIDFLNVPAQVRKTLTNRSLRERSHASYQFISHEEQFRRSVDSEAINKKTLALRLQNMVRHQLQSSQLMTAQ